MKITPQFLLFFPAIFFVFLVAAQSDSSCRPQSCGSNVGPVVRFPFRLRGRQSARCGYPGFNLSCNSWNQTVIDLPGAGEFRVNAINYRSQSLSIGDPDMCIPNRILNFSLWGSRFHPANRGDYIFLNCSFGDIVDYSASFPYYAVSCLSGRNHTVYVGDLDSSRDSPVPARCWKVRNVSAPVQWTGPMKYRPTVRMMKGIDLVWSDPSCFQCEKSGRICGFVNASNLEIGCYSDKTSDKSGLSRRAKYGIIVGLGIPGLVCIIGLVCYTCGLIKVRCLRRGLDPEIPVAAVSNDQTTAATTTGLDKPTIESYPKTELGASGRLPNPNDGTCPICLCEYQPKDTLRSIPECNHYFHVGCIDEWLRLNGSCPLCRNSPDSSIATPCSSLSLSSPSLSSTSDNRPSQL